MTDASSAISPEPSARDILARCFAAAGLLLAILGGASLGVRTISSPDIGYHLAYGDAFLQTGRIVDSSPEVYTLDPDALARARELPPGSWIDAAGVYRFPNANWLSQIVFSLVHRAGGMIGLGLLQAAMVLGILLVTAIGMRRVLGLSAAWSAVGVLLLSLTAYERFMLRPELMGYAVLATQALLLGPIWQGRGGLSWRRATALVLLQGLLVNLHSYWPLGLGLTLAGLGGVVLGAIFPPEEATTRKRGAGWKSLTALLLLQGAIGFCNPWTWRITLLPFQTLAFFSRYGISTTGPRAGGHPWSVIGEFFRPWESPFADVVATKGLVVLLATVFLALLEATLRRRWSLVCLLAGMTAMMLTMRRNLAPGAILLTPAALAGLVRLLETRPTWKTLAALSLSPVAAAVAPGFLAAVLLGAVTTNRFYVEQRRADRFGLGLSTLNTPILAAQWLSEVQPEGRIWTDYDSSSNLHYFTAWPDPENPSRRVHPDVPILTNTWAYPPDVMAEVLDVSRGMRTFRQMVDMYGVEVVALRVSVATTPLTVYLAENPDWALVYLDALHAVWLRRAGPNASLTRKWEIRRDRFHLSAYLEQLRRMDPEAPFAFHAAGVTLQRLGWFDEAIAVLRQAVRESPRCAESWFELGACHALRSQETRQKAPRGEATAAVLRDLREAQECFRRCLDLQPSREYRDKAQNYLQGIQRDYTLLVSQSP